MPFMVEVVNFPFTLLFVRLGLVFPSTCSIIKSTFLVVFPFCIDCIPLSLLGDGDACLICLLILAGDENAVTCFYIVLVCNRLRKSFCSTAPLSNLCASMVFPFPNDLILFCFAIIYK